MNRSLIAASALSTAIGLALATSALPAQAQGKMDMSKAPQIVKDNMARMEKNKLEKCYGINAVAKNDLIEIIRTDRVALQDDPFRDETAHRSKIRRVKAPAR